MTSTKEPKVRRDYRLQDGTKVPGVTTVIGGLGWSKDRLIGWAWKQGKEGKDHNETRDAAAAAGTLGHDVIEARLLGRSVDEVLARAVDDEQREKAERAFEAFLQWADNREVVPLYTELEIVSERLRVGGTIDLIARVDGRLVLIDHKTGSGVYDEAVIQVATYRELWRETRDEPIEDVVILHVSSKTAEFTVHRFPEEKLAAAFEAFRHLRALHDLKRTVEIPYVPKPKKARGAA